MKQLNDEKLDRLLESQQQIVVNMESMRVLLNGLVDQSHDHEMRIRLIERWKNQLTPMLAVMTFVLGVVVSVTVDRWF